METYKDRFAETERVRERRRARIERGAVDVPEEPGYKDEQVAVRHADASGGYILVNQHEEKIVRDIQVGKRGSEAASEEQSDTGGRQNDLSKKLRTHQHLPIHMLLWNILRLVRHFVGWSPYLCRSQVMLMTTCKFLRWMPSTRRMDEGVVASEKCWSGIAEKMPEISKEVN